MTRINVVPVEELHDKHLVAEYRELPRALRRAVIAIGKGKQPEDFKIAPNYLLNTGHETFFIDKGKWLWHRWCSLRDEMINRGMEPSDDFKCIVKSRIRHIRRHGKVFYNDYTVTREAYIINVERILERLDAMGIDVFT